MKTIKIVAALTSAFLAFGLVGCQGNESANDAADDMAVETIDSVPIEVTQQGFSVGDSGEVSYAFISVNPNEGYTANSVVFTISGYDSTGAMVLGNVETLDKIYPEIETPVVGRTFLANTDDEIVKLDVKVSMESVRWTATDVDLSNFSSQFGVADPRNGRGNDGAVNVSGRVVATNAASLAAIEGVDEDNMTADLMVLLIDSQGNPVYGAKADEIKFDEFEGVVQEVSDIAEEGDSEIIAQTDEADLLRSAPFSVSIPDAPSYKEVKYYLFPVIH